MIPPNKTSDMLTAQNLQFNLTPYTNEMLAQKTANVSYMTPRISLESGSHNVYNMNQDIYQNGGKMYTRKQVQFGVQNSPNDISSKGSYVYLNNGRNTSTATSNNTNNNNMSIGVPTGENEVYAYKSVPTIYGDGLYSNNVLNMPDLMKAKSSAPGNNNLDTLNYMKSVNGSFNNDMRTGPKQVMKSRNTESSRVNINTKEKPIQKQVTHDVKTNGFVNTTKEVNENKFEVPLKVDSDPAPYDQKISRRKSKNLERLASMKFPFILGNSRSSDDTTNNKQLKNIGKSNTKLGFSKSSNKVSRIPTIYPQEPKYTPTVHSSSTNKFSGKSDASTDANILSKINERMILQKSQLKREVSIFGKANIEEKGIVKQQNISTGQNAQKIEHGDVVSPLKGQNKKENNIKQNSFSQEKNFLKFKGKKVKSKSIKQGSALLNTRKGENLKSYILKKKKELPNVFEPAVNKEIITKSGGLKIFEKFIIIDKYDGLKRWNGFEWERILDDRVFFRRIKYDNLGSLWCITDSYDVLKITNGKIKKLGLLGNEEISDLGFDKKNVLWSINKNGKLLKWNKMGWRKISYSGFLKLTNMAFDLQGNLWAINSKGVLGVWNSKSNCWDETILKDNIKISFMEFDEIGMLWVVAKDGSLHSYSSGKWINHGFLHTYHLVSFAIRRF